ncbi:MAG: LacI family DNA-binding transcriptional regulator [Chthoniobacteraceae bacterium]
MEHSDTTVALEDIAEKLGIAVSTVSRALRNLPGIHPATRAKVVREAEALGYVAPSKRNGDAAPQPRNILMLTLGANEAPPGFLAGMSRASLSFNFSLLSHVSSLAESHNLLIPKYQPPLLKMGQVAGIILIYGWPEDVARELSRQWPTVSIVMHYPGLPIDVIGIDHVEGMFSLVKHLKESGHKQIGFFGLKPEISWARSRFAAYAEAMLAFGLPFDFENVVQIREDKSVVKLQSLDTEAMETVMSKIKKGVRAWVCANDVLGQSLYSGLIQRGIRIPEDVAITGFHQRRYHSPNLPPLTTTEVNEEMLGAAALRRLAYRLDHPEESHRLILMPCNFIQGQSTLDPANTRVKQVAASV